MTSTRCSALPERVILSRYVNDTTDLSYLGISQFVVQQKGSPRQRCALSLFIGRKATPRLSVTPDLEVSQGVRRDSR